MPTPLKGAYNLHTVYMYGQRLGVECKDCHGRGLAFADRDLDGFKGDMRELRSLRFKCCTPGYRH